MAVVSLLFAGLGNAIGCADSQPDSSFESQVRRGWELRQFQRWEELKRHAERLAEWRPRRSEGHYFGLHANCHLGNRAEALSALSELVRTGVRPDDFHDGLLRLIADSPEYADAREQAHKQAQWIVSVRQDPVLPQALQARRYESVADMRQSFMAERDAFVRMQEELSPYLRLREWVHILNQQLADVAAAPRDLDTDVAASLQIDVLRAHRCWPGLETPSLAYSALGEELDELGRRALVEGGALASAETFAAAMEGALRLGKRGDAMKYAAATMARSGTPPSSPEERAATVVARIGCLEDRELAGPVCQQARRWLDPWIAESGISAVVPWLLEGGGECHEATLTPVLQEVPKLALTVQEWARENRVRGFELLGLERFPGKYVLVDFWTSWCQPCLDDVSVLRDLRARTPELEIIGVNMDREADGWDRERVDALCQTLEIRWPVVTQPRGFDDGLPRAFGVRTVPTYILLDPSGIPVMVEMGSRPGLADRVRAHVVSATPAAKHPPALAPIENVGR